VASITAADCGAKVLQLEKTAELGGTFLISQGTTAGTQTRLQFENSIYDDSPYLFYSDCMKEQRAREVCDPESLMFYCKNSGFAVDWLDELGAYPDDNRSCIETIYGEDWSRSRVYRVDWAIDYLRAILPEHEKRVASGNITVKLNTHVDSLIANDQSVTGVVADGEEVSSGAVIVCTGGYTANPELMRKYKMAGARSIVTAGSTNATGDGLVMCQRAGAKLVNMDQELLPYMGNVADPENPVKAITYVDMNHPSAIWVDLNGKRIINEDSNIYLPPARIAMINAPEMLLYVVIDSKAIETDRCILTKWLGTVPVYDWDWFLIQAENDTFIKKADTLAELSVKMNVNSINFETTINAWNRYVVKGKDIEFGRNTCHNTLDKPPYYAIETSPAVLISAGGPATNYRQEVLSNTHGVIKGLYAAGEITGYRAFGTGGLNTGNVVYGKQAGLMASIYALNCHT